MMFSAIAVLIIAAAPDGASLYKAKCQSCHGPKGEGTKRYKRALEGDLAVPQLARLIRETMPEGQPNTLDQADAAAIAEHIHKEFYSQLARERSHPPRVELARLTIPQYRQSMADLVGSFRPASGKQGAEGLKGEYFKNRRFNNGDRVLERTDPGVNLALGKESPVPGMIEPHEFSIRWTGSIIAPETGEYEFIVKTEHAARLWVNDPDTPVIDAWVKSGNDTEYKGVTRLLAGRAHPLRLEYSKAKQGVNDANKTKAPPPSAPTSIHLLWRRPDMPPRLVPAKALRVTGSSPVFASSAAFPPDDASLGWERGSAISKAWDQAATDGALEAVAHVMARIDDFSKSKAADADRTAKLKEFCAAFATRAFRAPLAQETRSLYVDRPFTGSPDPETGARRALLAILKSPRFLYPGLEARTDSHAIAAHLALSLWDSLPDPPLSDLAASGKLARREVMLKEAERMLADPRARAKLARFFHHWLRADHAADVAKDMVRFPGFTRDHLASLRESLEWKVDEFLGSAETDYRKLFEGDSVPLDGKLAKFFGVELPPDAPMRDVPLPGQGRAGILTHPFVLAVHAYGAETSPIHRGVFVARNILGVALKPPPEAVSPIAPDLHPSLTTRERVILQTKPTACVSCHGIINPLGFPLEAFDAIGRQRTQDRGKPVDTKGSFLDKAGGRHSFANAMELAGFIRGSRDARDSFVEQVFHHLAGQPVRAYGSGRPVELGEAFTKGGHSLKRLCCEIALVTAPGSGTRVAESGSSPLGGR